MKKWLLSLRPIQWFLLSGWLGFNTGMSFFEAQESGIMAGIISFLLTTWVFVGFAYLGHHLSKAKK